MNNLPLHPLVVHLPIALAVLMPMMAGALLLAWHRNWLPSRSWGLVVLMQATLLLTGLAASATGEEDEEIVERVVPHAALERHEEAAEVFLWGVGVVLALAVATLLLRASRGKLLGSLTLLGTLAVLALGIRVGHAGGELVYKHGAAAAHATGIDAGGAVPAKAGLHDDDDD